MAQTEAMEPSQERQPLLHRVHSQHGYTDSIKSAATTSELDSDHPLNWSKKYRWSIVALLCMSGAAVTYTCGGIVPVAGDVIQELEGHRDRSATVLFVTIWELGEAMGPLVLAPLSERYGRFRVYNVANGLFVTGIAITALSKSTNLLIFARFATGCTVAANVLNPAIIGDMFPSESRGAAMSAVMLAPLIGGAIGPIVSGSLAEIIGWRGTMWLTAIIACVIDVLLLTLFQETYLPVILKRRVTKKSLETGDSVYATACDEQGEDAQPTFWQSMLRPARILWSSSMLQWVSLWYGVMFAFVYVNLTSFADILEVIYGFSPAKTGVAYLAWSLGSLIGVMTCNRTMDKIYKKLGKRHGKFYPEGRLPLAITGAFLLPLAVTLYGWTAQARNPLYFFLPTVTLLCFAIMLSLVASMTFITDAFGMYSASAITAALVTRCLMGALLPLTVPPLVNDVGYGWTFTVLAAVALVLAVIPCLVMRYGPTWRQRSAYTKDI